MEKFQIKLDNGKEVQAYGETPEHACFKAADLHQAAAIAWRRPPVSIGVMGDPRYIQHANDR